MDVLFQCWILFQVYVNYVGRLAVDNPDIDESKFSQPFEFELGTKQFIEGWEEGILGIREGGPCVIALRSPSLKLCKLNSRKGLG